VTFGVSPAYEEWSGHPAGTLAGWQRVCPYGGCPGKRIKRIGCEETSGDLNGDKPENPATGFNGGASGHFRWDQSCQGVRPSHREI